MDTKEVIQKSFKKLLTTTPYDKITVTNICEQANISRKTFYVHFCDKNEIVEQLLLQDVIEPMSSLHNLLPHIDADSAPELITEKLYQSFYEKRDYYSKIVEATYWCQSTFIKIATDKIYAVDLQILNELGFRGSTVELDYTCYFFASSQAILLQKWIRDRMIVPPKEMARFYCKWTMPYWRSLYDGWGGTAEMYSLQSSSRA